MGKQKFGEPANQTKGMKQEKTKQLGSGFLFFRRYMLTLREMSGTCAFLDGILPKVLAEEVIPSTTRDILECGGNMFWICNYSSAVIQWTKVDVCQ